MVRVRVRVRVKVRVRVTVRVRVRVVGAVLEPEGLRCWGVLSHIPWGAGGGHMHLEHLSIVSVFPDAVALSLSTPQPQATASGYCIGAGELG